MSALVLAVAPNPFALRTSLLYAHRVPARTAMIASASLSWATLEDALPSALDTSGPATIAGNASGEDLAGKLVLYRDANGHCPYTERIWLALEIKRIPFVTCLVEHSEIPPGEAGALPHVQWPDGSTTDGSDTLHILERIEREYPQPPSLFPDKSVTVNYVRDFCDARFDGVMPRFTLPSRTTPYVFACRIQRAGSFKIEECEVGEIVPQYKYEVCLEEIDEILDEDIRDPGPFFAGRCVSAADVWAAPFLERFAAHLPLLYDGLTPRPPAGTEPAYEAIAAWYDAMDEKVPCYSCRIKGRVRTWQQLLASEPYLEGRLEQAAATPPDLSADFDATRVWAKYAARTSRPRPYPQPGPNPDPDPDPYPRYAEGRPHVAPTPALEAAAVIVRNREVLRAGAAQACGLSVDVADTALRDVCAALVSGGGNGGAADPGPDAPTLLADAALEVAAYLDGGPIGMAVPHDFGVVPAEALRSLVKRSSQTP